MPRTVVVKRRVKDGCFIATLTYHGEVLVRASEIFVRNR